MRVLFMKKFLIFTLSILGVLLIGFGIFLFMLFRPVAVESGPKAYYRVDEGAVEVFSLKNGEVKSLLAYLKPGESFMAPTVSKESLEVPFWLNWIEPMVVNAVGRARYFMYKESKKSKYDEFTVGYTNKTIRKGFVRELEQTRLLRNIELDFLPDEFSFFAQVTGVSITARGIVSVPDPSGDKLLMHLKSLKIGSFTVPENGLRAVENLFAKAYTQSGNFPIKLLKIKFTNETMIMSFRKTAGSGTGIFS